MGGDASFSEPAYQRFCRELLRHPNPSLAAAGRYAAFTRRFGRAKKAGTVSVDMLDELEAIRRQLRAAGALDFYLESNYDRPAFRYQASVGTAGQDRTTEAGQSPPPQPSKPKPDPGTGRLRFTKVDLRIIDKGQERAFESAWWRAPGGYSSIKSLENCGSFDVMWGRSSLLFGRRPASWRQGSPGRTIRSWTLRGMATVSGS